ncbi:protease inhibitor I42 family protein [Bradyrhizobium sp. 13971]
MRHRRRAFVIRDHSGRRVVLTMRMLTTASDNEVAIGEDFEIAIEEPGASGYRFRASFDERFLSLLSERHSVSKPFGNDCTAQFRFRARASGNCELAFTLCAPWDPEPGAVRTFLLRIKGSQD